MFKKLLGAKNLGGWASIFCVAKSCFVAISLIVSFLIQPVQAAEKVGSAVKIIPNVTGSQGNRKLANQSPVYRGERISAKQGGHGELRLNDNSRIVVGRNSSISLDQYVAASSNSAKKGAIRVSKGAFRFISGNSKKGVYTIKTPNSTIGVRGTAFDVYVGKGVERVVVFNGALDVCSSKGCVKATRACDIVETKRGQRPEKLPFYKSRDDKTPEGEFRLLKRQMRFAWRWRAPVMNCYARAAMEGINRNSNNIRIGSGGTNGSDSKSDPSPSPSPNTGTDTGTGNDTGSDSDSNDGG